MRNKEGGEGLKQHFHQVAFQHKHRESLALASPKMKTVANVYGTFLKHVKTTLTISVHMLVMDLLFLYLIKCKQKFRIPCFEYILIIVLFPYMLVTCFYSLATTSKSS